MASYKEKYNSLPYPGSGYAYDVIRILITAFEKEEATNEGVAKTISRNEGLSWRDGCPVS